MQPILVVDDDHEIVRVVRAYLERAGFTVLSAYDGDSALHTLRREQPALVVLDLMLPDRDGWDLTRLIRSDTALAETPIIMLTARIEDTEKIVGLELGADDYITKPFNPREVVARVRSVLRRSQPSRGKSNRRVLEWDALLLDLDRHQVTLNDKPVELTTTEFNLLKVLMENPGYAFTRSELIERGMGYEYEGSERTLDSHIRNLRRKIEPDPDNIQYIQTVYGVGYRFIM
jgi:two-component system alkaline phosphatase synthesis response regulator PhoP